MKKHFRFVFCALLLTVFNSLLACGLKTETQEAQGDVKVQIPIQNGANSQLKVVALQGIDDLRHVSGGFAVFFYAPKIEGQFVNGEYPLARFAKANGIFLPMDNQSAEMSSIYYHLQSLAGLDSRVGLAGLNKWPRRVALSTRIRKSEELVRNNSFYDQNSDAMIFVDFESPDLSLALNPGVIAHEHFHSIFSKLFLLPLIKAEKLQESLKAPPQEEAQAFSNLMGAPEIKFNLSSFLPKSLKAALSDFILVKALNEGLADFWGWVYSQDEKFVTRSLPSEKFRNLDVAPSGFESPAIRAERLASYVEALKNAKNKKRSLEIIQDIGGAYAYQLGSSYARFFRSLAKDAKKKDGLEVGQIELAKRIAALLPILRDGLLNSEARSIIEPENIIEAFKNANPDLYETHCKKFKAILKSEVECPGDQP